MKKSILFLSFCLTFNLFSQSSADKSLGVWYTFSGSHKIHRNISIKSLGHFRFFDTKNDLQQILLRLGANYKLNKNFSFSLGYGYLKTDKTFKIDGGEFNEHRLYEDFIYKQKINTLKLFHRLRVEHRFFKDDTQHWARYRFGLTQPIKNNWSTFVYNETFFNITKGKVFTQNWLGLGFNYKLNKFAKLIFGYQKIYNSLTDFDRLLIGLSFNTNHTKN